MRYVLTFDQLYSWLWQLSPDKLLEKFGGVGLASRASTVVLGGDREAPRPSRGANGLLTERAKSATIRYLVIGVLGLAFSPVSSAAMSNLGKLWLKSATNWAVIGDVLNSNKPASRVVSTLREAGKTVHLINPRDKTGECFAGLSDVGAPIEVVDLCINHVEGLKQMEQAAALGINKVFIQPGAGSEDILNFCEDHNVEVFMGCVMVENGGAH